MLVSCFTLDLKEPPTSLQLFLAPSTPFAARRKLPLSDLVAATALAMIDLVCS
jgi:hypothetical protein